VNVEPPDAREAEEKKREEIKRQQRQLSTQQLGKYCAWKLAARNRIDPIRTVFGFRFEINLRPVEPFQTRTQYRAQHLLNAPNSPPVGE
jgi:hypothetical protein